MKFIVSILLILLCIISPVYAWNDEATHPTLSEFAAEKYFGADFMVSYINGIQVKKYIRAGSQLEDTGNLAQFLGGTARSLNHFHNASKATLAEARLTDVPTFMPIGGSPTWESTPLWAQDGDNQRTKVNGDWSWNMVRSVYYKYLITSDSSLRELWQVDYLKGLGYQMHLIQDMGQPNHVRNDTHIWDGASLVLGLETWARRKDVEIIKNQILDNMTTIPAVTVNLIAPFAADSTKAPVANLFDTRSYLGTRSPSAAFNQGLAEYTNANFFSENTIFASEYGTDDKHYQPYPRKDETNIQDFIDEQMALTTVTNDDDFGSFDTFVVKKQTTNGEPLNCIATSGPFSRKLYQEWGEDKYFYRSFMYDSCFREYAEKLIPASVAYSKAMLEYFHRGKLEITPPDQQVYSIIDGSMTTQQFTTITAKVKNTTPNEAITAGSLVAVARYKVDANYLPDLSNNPTDNTLASFAYSVSAPVTISPAMNTTPTEYIFDFSGSPIPAGITDLTLQVVFKGTLGNETDIAIAVGMKDVSEPTHHVFWNLSDMFSLDYNLYKAQDIRANPVLVDSAGDAQIDPFVMDFEIAYSPASSTTFSADVLGTVTLPAGRHIRLIGIFDNDAPNYLQFNYSRSGATTASYVSSGITGAVAENGTNTPAIFGFRYWDNGGNPAPIRQHYKIGIVNCKPLSENPDGSSYCAYQEEQANAAGKSPYAADPL